MENLREFFAMGGYALFVWPAYLCAFLILSANIVIPILQLRRIKNVQAKHQRLQEQTQVKQI